MFFFIDYVYELIIYMTDSDTYVLFKKILFYKHIQL